jgi:hypothetical protein
MATELSERCNVIEECYEFMLAYAGQGLSGEGSDGQVRDLLTRAVRAIDGLEHSIPATEPYGDFRDVVARDARDSLAAVRLVLAQTAISSQLIDNLNASIHLRALLTDLFLIDEILKAQARDGSTGAAKSAD